MVHVDPGVSGSDQWFRLNVQPLVWLSNNTKRSDHGRIVLDRSTKGFTCDVASFLAALNCAVASSSAVALLAITPCCKSCPFGPGHPKQKERREITFTIHDR